MLNILASGIELAAFVTAIITLIGLSKKVIAPLVLIKKSQLAVLRFNIAKTHSDCCDKGVVVRYTLLAVTEMYEQYKAMGGNGFVAELITDIKICRLRGAQNERQRAASKTYQRAHGCNGGLHARICFLRGFRAHNGIGSHHYNWYGFRLLFRGRARSAQIGYFFYRVLQAKKKKKSLTVYVRLFFYCSQTINKLFCKNY